MLQQAIRPCLRQATQWTPKIRHKSCVVCTCQCGVQFQPKGNQRQYATRRMAPSTWEQKRRTEAAYLTPQEKRHRQAFDQEQQRQFYGYLDWLHRTGTLSTNPNDAINFLTDFEALVGKSRGRPVPDPADYRKLSERYNISHGDAMGIAQVLLSDHDRDANYRAKKLVLSLSRAGYTAATLFVMGQAQLQAKRKPGVLKSLEIAHSRAHLRQVADEGFDYRAMVLEGKIALALGDQSRAILLWTKAMDAAVAAANESRRLRMEGKRPPEGLRGEMTDDLELSSPWIELMLIHYQRSAGKPEEMAKCQWAMDIGCEQDDPTSHYYTASFTKRVDNRGSHIATSNWLYHMTKASSSGHQRACHELAVFYAQSGWKYIEDEPPDHIKPTAFDSYPPSTTLLRAFWTRMLEIVGFAQPPKNEPTELFFHTATFPHTAVDRFKLAFAWLEVPIYYNYAPSFLFKAKMYMQETLWAGANAPQSALKLTQDRYTYASKEDCDAGIPIEKEEREEPQDPPNPFYDLEEARSSLREVFNAYEANIQVESTRTKQAGRRLRGTGGADDDDAIERQSLNMPPRLRKWFRFPVVREMYEDELEELYAEAKAICDEHGWDMYDQEGGLLYKAKANRVKVDMGEPLAAAAAGA